jgi:hypothetical protein
MKAFVCALATVLLLSSSSSSAQINGRSAVRPTSGEPSAVLDVWAKTVERNDLASTTRVRVELSLTSEIDIPSVRVRGTRVGSPGFDEELGIADRVLTLRRNAGRKLVYELELERGSVHHLIFYAESRELSGLPPAHRSSAYLRINLDPTLEPEHLGHVLQYRARMADGGGQ